MPTNALALNFLDDLEQRESRVLTWGLVDGFFGEDEVEALANEFLQRAAASGEETPFDSGWDMVEALLDERLLWKIPGEPRYRTRMAETIRLLARLKQIFPDPPNYQGWRNAPSLVADYRLQIRRRSFPRRIVAPNALLDSLRSHIQILPVQESVIRSFLRADTSEPRQLARFQERSTDRILQMAGRDRSLGTVVCAGTGSGKTLAFYLPAYAVIARLLSAEYWTKCLAIYPRNELLKDQLKEAIANARRIAPALAGRHKRKLIVAALYSKVPESTRALLADESPWEARTVAGQRGFECPFVRCPSCNEPMVWSEADIRNSLERLRCIDTSCNSTIEPDEIRLTRQRMLAEPPDILFTSTEMLNRRLSSARYARLFGLGLKADRRPQFVLIDEVHSYEGANGAQVALLLRRWRKASEAQPHFVGLSATLADASRFFAELVGLGPGDVQEISPNPGDLRVEGAEYMLALRGDPSSGTSLLSTTIQALMLMQRVLATRPDEIQGTKVFAFTDNLDVINRLYHNLLDAEGWDAARLPVRPFGSLANLRATTLPNADPRMRQGQNWALVEDIGHPLVPGSQVSIGRTSSQDTGVDAAAGIIVATAALEVGFDDPDVGAVVQHKAPHSASSFLQRKGRAGRRQEMRPWTVVILSDYGRDRIAYQGYDQLFSPALPPRYLPLRNRAILKMQAVFVLFDWLGRRLPSGHSADPWTDFSQPPSAFTNVQTRVAVQARQQLYAHSLRGLLDQPEIRDDLARFLARSLGLELSEVAPLLWEPPRAIITEAVPTLLRRLEVAWNRADGSGQESYATYSPMPEFIPSALFEDLQLPEVTIRIPRNQHAPKEEHMGVAQALREFAPGRVSRRFGITHGRQRYWIAAGNGPQVSIESFCPANDRFELGQFRYRDDEGNLQSIVVFRPYALNVTLTPNQIQQSSNSFLHWRTEIVPTDVGHQLDLPDGSRWLPIIRNLSVHAHLIGLPLEVRRFALGATASIGQGQGPQTIRDVEFVSGPDGNGIAAAIGFASDSDGIEVGFVYPIRLYEVARRDGQLVRGLRAAHFRYLVQQSPAISRVANDFQRQWLAQLYLSTVTAEALRTGKTLEEAEDSVFQGTSTTRPREVLDTILQWSDDADATAQTPPAGPPVRVVELLAIFSQISVKEALHLISTVMWEDSSETWEPWLRQRFKAPLGAALLEAARYLCPRIDPGALTVDLEALTSGLASPHNEPHPDVDRIWLTESNVGGAGFVEDFMLEYQKDPRRFFRLVDSAFAPSDLETVSEDLRRLLAAISPGGDDSLSVAFRAMRSTGTHAESLSALRQLRAELVKQNILPTPTFMVSMNARLLRPGSTSDLDTYLADALQDWDEGEARLGIDIDARVFALVKSNDATLDQMFGAQALNLDGNAARAWRYSLLSGALWPRGSQVRSESLRVSNPFERSPECDRLLVLTALEPTTRRISLDNAGWFEELSDVLVRSGSASLTQTEGRAGDMSAALLRMAAEPIDSETLLVYARLIGVRREAGLLIADLELPEAIQ
jgi:hypothetical protein